MNEVNFKVLMIYLFALLLILFPFKSFGFYDYDVEWPPSGEKGIHLLLITIDKCETKFKVKEEDFESFTSNKKAISDALKKAIERAESGCK